MRKTKHSTFFGRRIRDSLVHALRGICAAWRSEEALRVELVLLPILVAVAVYADLGKAETVLLIGSGVLVVVVELLNTGLEKAVDRISTQQHHLSKFVKDVGSGAVLVAILNCLLTWGIIFI